MNEQNPFFAADAELLLKSGLFNKAISICKNGLSQYPLYFSGWKLLIEIYISAGNNDEAKSTADYALSLFPGSVILENLRKELEGNFRNVDSHDKSPVPTDFDDIDDSNNNINSYTNNLQEIAKKLEEVSAPLPESKYSSHKNYPNGIITETIAKIYISQGALPEAIDAYRNLININPNKISYYLEKITELEHK